MSDAADPTRPPGYSDTEWLDELDRRRARRGAGMTLPKCPCGEEPAQRRSHLIPMGKFRVGCGNGDNGCCFSTPWYDSPADAERAWCRMVAAVPMEKALGNLLRAAGPDEGDWVADPGSDEVVAAHAALKAARGGEDR